MKLFTASLGTETNTFSPFLTGYQDFVNTYLARNGKHGDEPFSYFAMPLVTWRNQATERAWSVVESLCTFAQPGGVTVDAVYEAFRDEILQDLQQAMPVDGVLLSLHGAMIAQSYDDCEGDLTFAIRKLIGPDIPIGVELDLHCHLTPLLTDNATVVITFKEYPHTDVVDRAAELFTLIAETIEGNIQPHITLHDCHMIGVYHTTQEPMKSYVAHLQALEQQAGILSVSLGHGFPWGDLPEMGTQLLVITDNQPERGTTLAQELHQKLFELRAHLQPPYRTINEALDEALAAENGPIVLADVSDNAGGGAPSDSTFMLQAMLERGIKNGAVAAIWDPIAVEVAMTAGEGAHLSMRIGGKMGPMSGDPLDVSVTVTKIIEEMTQPFGQAQNRLGHAVALHTQGIDIVINANRTQVFNPAVFSQLGIDPTTKQILVVKSMQHFQADFAPIAAKILYVAAPGALVPNFKQLPYQRANQQKWPLTDA